MSIFVRRADGVIGADTQLVAMQFEASKASVLVRRDQEGDWWVIALSPTGIDAHIIDQLAAAVEGYASPWSAALDLARRHIEGQRAFLAALDLPPNASVRVHRLQDIEGDTDE